MHLKLLNVYCGTFEVQILSEDSLIQQEIETTSKMSVISSVS